MLIVEKFADTFPDVFTGDYTDGDAYDFANYDFTQVSTCDGRESLDKGDNLLCRPMRECSTLWTEELW